MPVYQMSSNDSMLSNVETIIVMLFLRNIPHLTNLTKLLLWHLTTQYHLTHTHTWHLFESYSIQAYEGFKFKMVSYGYGKMSLGLLPM
jgi:hypothetical protein